MSWSECKYCGVAWSWLRFLLHPERPEQVQSQFLEVQSRGFTRSIKLTIELPEHSNDKLPQRLGKNEKSIQIIMTSTLSDLLTTMHEIYSLPGACSAPQSSWKHRLRVLGSCSLKRNCWRTGTGSPWCSERCWTWPGQTPDPLPAAGCSGGPSLCAHSSC